MTNEQIKETLKKVEELTMKKAELDTKISELKASLENEYKALLPDTSDQTQIRNTFFTLNKVVKEETEVDPVKFLKKSRENALIACKYIMAGNKFSVSAKKTFQTFIKENGGDTTDCVNTKKSISYSIELTPDNIANAANQ